MEEIAMAATASLIENYWLLHGEYDYGVSDRITWIDAVVKADPYELADDAELLRDARQKVVDAVFKTLIGTAPKEYGSLESLISYFDDQIEKLSSEQEDISEATAFREQLASMFEQLSGGRV